MRNFIKVTLALILLTPLTGMAGVKLGKLAEQNKGKSIAVVSISANNWSNSLQGWNGANTSELMGTQLNDMLIRTESLFAEDWKVIKAETFIKNPEFRALAGEQREVGVPYIDGVALPLFSKNRKQLVKTRVDKDVAQKLIKVTGADFILIVYSEWAVKTGSFVPTSKALAKNVMGIYDASGKQVYKGREDTMGNRTLGAVGRVAVNEGTIDQWVYAFENGITTLFNQGRKYK